jgi:hypothetical protein
MHLSLVHYCYLFKPLVNYLIGYMVAKSSHILVHIVLGRLGLISKVLMLWSKGEEHHFITPIRTLILNVLQVF